MTFRDAYTNDFILIRPEPAVVENILKKMRAETMSPTPFIKRIPVQKFAAAAAGVCILIASAVIIPSILKNDVPTADNLNNEMFTLIAEPNDIPEKKSNEAVENDGVASGAGGFYDYNENDELQVTEEAEYAAHDNPLGAAVNSFASIMEPAPQEAPAEIIKPDERGDTNENRHITEEPETAEFFMPETVISIITSGAEPMIESVIEDAGETTTNAAPIIAPRAYIHWYGGVHNGFDVAIFYEHEIVTDDIKIIEIAGYEFTLQSGSFELMAYKDGMFTELPKAYNYGLLSNDDIAAIHKVYYADEEPAMIWDYVVKLTEAYAEYKRSD